VVEWMRVISLTRQPQNSTGPAWTDNDLPACPVGMELLCRFEEMRPNDYAFLQMQDFTDLHTCAFAGIAEWDAFTAHYATCEDCKEQRAASGER